MTIKELVLAYLGGPFKCYGHCQEPAQLLFVREGDRPVAAQVCPGGYVSRLILYADSSDPVGLKEYVTGIAHGAFQVSERDIRSATRYGWDLGVGGNERVLGEAYWVQNYGRSKSSDPERRALFVCSSCGAPFIQAFSCATSLCADCTRRASDK